MLQIINPRTQSLFRNTPVTDCLFSQVKLNTCQILSGLTRVTIKGEHAGHSLAIPALPNRSGLKHN